MKAALRLRVPLPWLRPDVLVASIGVNVFALAMPLVVLQVYDRIVPNDALTTLGVLISVLVVAALFEGFLRIARSILLAWRGMKFEHEYLQAAVSRLLRADLAEFDRRPHGAYLDRLQALEQVREFFYGQSILMVVDLPFVLLFLTLIYVFAGDLVLIPISVIGAFLIVSIVTAHFLRRALRLRSDMDERKQNFLIEAIQGIHTIKALAAEPQMCRRFERLQGQATNSIYLLARVNSIAQALGVTFAQVVMVSFIAIGGIFAVRGEISIGALAAGTMLAGRVLQPALKAMSLWTHLQSVRLAKERFQEMLSLETEGNVADEAPAAIRGKLALKNVSFQHPASNEALLENLSLEVEPGEAIGITGGNGVGKSTLLDLFLGFVEPNEGEVLIDGRPLSEFERHSLRAQVALVPQKGVLFSGTLMENLTLFREGPVVDEALALSVRLGLDETIARLPKGLNTEVGGGSTDAFSDGFRQRIVVVRSLLTNPKVILFDDANAGFDSRNDERLAKLLGEFKGERTMIIVSHRPSVLRLCDRVYQVSDRQLSLVDDSQAPAKAGANAR